MCNLAVHAVHSVACMQYVHVHACEVQVLSLGMAFLGAWGLGLVNGMIT